MAKVEYRKQKGLDFWGKGPAWSGLQIRKNGHRISTRRAERDDITEQPRADQSSKSQTHCPDGIALALASNPCD
jgi:hypothetical protein